MKRLQSFREDATIVNHHPFGRVLREFLHRREVFALMPHDGGWTNGGCLALANALKRWTQTGKVIAVATKSNTPPDTIHHFALRLGEICLDGDGMAWENEMLEKARRLEAMACPYIVRNPDIAAAVKAGIPRWKTVENKLVPLLAREFGPFRVELVSDALGRW